MKEIPTAHIYYQKQMTVKIGDKERLAVLTVIWTPSGLQKLITYSPETYKK